MLLDSKSSCVKETGTWTLGEHLSPMAVGVCFTFYTAPAGFLSFLPQTVSLISISIIKVKSERPTTTKKKKKKSKTTICFKDSREGGPFRLVVDPAGCGLS